LETATTWLSQARSILSIGHDHLSDFCSVDKIACHFISIVGQLDWRRRSHNLWIASSNDIHKGWLDHEFLWPLFSTNTSRVNAFHALVHERVTILRNVQQRIIIFVVWNARERESLRATKHIAGLLAVNCVIASSISCAYRCFLKPRWWIIINLLNAGNVYSGLSKHWMFLLFGPVFPSWHIFCTFCCITLMLLLREHVTATTRGMYLTKLGRRSRIVKSRLLWLLLLSCSFDLSGIYFTRQRHEAIGGKYWMLRLVIIIAVYRCSIVWFVYDILSTRTLSVHLVHTILMYLVSVLGSKIVNSMFMLGHFIICHYSSLWDLIRELNVIKCSTPAFTNWGLVLIITVNWHVLWSRMHNYRLLSRWGREVSLLLWRPVHISDIIVNIDAIGILNDSCTWLPRLQWLWHSLQPETLIILGLAIATLVWQLVAVLDKLWATPRWIGLYCTTYHMIISCWCRELVHL
jgi:hypothetical protein